MILKQSSLFIIIASVQICSGYRILFAYPFNGKSHFILVSQLSKGLARKGHQVDLISPFPMTEKYPNFTQIITLPSEAKSFVDSVDLNTAKTFVNDLSWMHFLGVKTCENLGNPEVLDLARNPPKDPPYDMVIVTMGMANCFMILGDLWKIPIAFVSTTSLYPWMHDTIGNPENIAISPNNMISISMEDGFFWRLYNAYAFYYLKFNYWYRTKPHDEIVQKYFGPEAPPIQELERNTSLILMNTYFPINGIKPMAKNLIEIGGVHIQNDGPELEPKLKNWLDQSNHGVIYFTFGTMFRIESFPDEILEIIFGSLEKLAPTRVLLRIVKPEQLRLKLPSNFYNMTWLPQEKILQHPKVKLFITHSGLLGTQESIYYGVPMLCIPLFVDQFPNSQTYVEKKIAVRVDIFSLTQEKFDQAINEVLKNPIYRNNVKKLSKLFKDRPANAIDTANYWIEYVIRNGRDSLRSPAMKLSWWQVALLDVLAFVVLGLFVTLCIAVVIIKSLLSLLVKTKSDMTTKEKKTS